MEQKGNMKPYGNPDAQGKQPEYYEIQDSELGRQYEPEIFRDGTEEPASYCCYCCGKNFIEGITGCGNTPQEAYNDWDRQMQEYLARPIEES
jgi:hypothetical protein